MHWLRVAFLATIAVLADASSRADADLSASERWLEILEQYQLPADPDWSATAELVAAAFGETSELDSPTRRKSSGGLGRPSRGPSSRGSSTLGRFVKATRSIDLTADFRRRLDRAGDNDRSRDAVIVSIEKEIDRIVQSADSPRSLTVVRAWDGITRKSAVFILGEKQRALGNRCKEGAVLLVETGASNCADHGHANGRPTILEARSKATPSEFLRAAEGTPPPTSLRFGEVEFPPDWSVTATKSDVVGSGEFVIRFDLPDGVPIDESQPWYCEFKLVALDASGTPVEEVRFEGAKAAVCVSSLGKPQREQVGGLTGRRRTINMGADGRPEYRAEATARIRIPRPGPHGYAAIVTGLWGVRPDPGTTASTAVEASDATEEPPAPDAHGSSEERD